MVSKLANKILVILFLFSSGYSFSQQDALYSQYMFNQFTINPAYAGSRNSLSGVLLYRNQWVGLKGAPNTMNFSIHSPFSRKKMALGLNFIVDEIGPTSTSSVMGTYAYHLKTTKGKISFGIRGGFFSTTLNNDELNYFDNNDVHNTGGVLQSTTPNFDFGVYYYNSKFYSGISINHLLGQTVTYQNSGQTQFNLNRYFNFATGGVLVLNEDLVVKPSIMVRYIAGAPINYDLNTSVLFNKTLWIGASYRSSKNMVLITEYNISDFLRIGYSYDFDLSKLRRYNSGTHEVFIGCDITLKNKNNNSISPRYL